MSRRLILIVILAALVVLYAPLIRAAGAFVGATGFRSAAATSISVTRTTTAHNAVLVSWFLENNCPTVSQSAGDTLTQRQSQDNGGVCLKHYSNYDVAGGSTTYTLSWSGAADAGMCVSEFSGLATVAFDVGAASTFQTNATIPTGTTAALAQSTEIAYASYHGDASGSTTFSSVSNGYTNIGGTCQDLSGSGMQMANAYKLAPLTTSGESTGFTLGDPSAGLGMVTTWKEAASAATPKGSNRLLLGVGRD